MPNSIVHDAAWHDAIYLKHADEIRRMLARRLPGDPRTAEDLTQETFMTAWVKCHLVPKEMVKAWLFKTAWFHLSNHRRSMGKYQLVELADNVIPLGQAIGAADHGIIDYIDVKRALGKLPRKDRVVLELAFMDDLGAEEIGAVLGLKAPAVRQRIKRAISRARDILSKASLDPYEKG